MSGDMGLRIDLALNLLHESPFNRRRDFGKLDELAASFKELGILQPLLAREVGEKKRQVELVFGHRRFRAAKLAGLETVPVIVREMTDEQVIEAQAIENLQRSDVHPIDEAETYEQLLKIGRSAEDIAERVGKSKAYVYGRLKLLALAKDVRTAFFEGKLTASVALYLARIPSPKLQAQAFKELDEWNRSDDPIGAREAFSVIERRFMLRLAEAPFDRADATLVPKAGTCKDCPKRTGNQAELFADVKSADVCTDPDCFDLKRRAHTKRELDQHRARGTKVLEGAAAKKVVSRGHLAYGSPYVDLSATCYEDAKHRKYSAILKGADLPLTVAVDEDGTLFKLVDKGAVARAMRAAGAKGLSANSVGRGPSAADDKKRREAAKRKRAVTMAILGQVVAKAEQSVDVEATFWPFLAEVLVSMCSHDAAGEIIKRRNLDVKKEGARPSGYRDYEKALLAAVRAAAPTAAKGLALELAISRATFSFGPYGSEGLGAGLLAAAKYFKVDAAKVSEKVRGELKAAKKTKRGAP